MKTYTVRTAVPSDWKAVRSVRLGALTHDAGFFSISYQQERKLIDSQWQRRCTPTTGHWMIVLYCKDDATGSGKLVGLTEISTWKQDRKRVTAYEGASYIDPTCRGAGLSRMLYGARRESLERNIRFKKTAVNHRCGHIASKKANMREGERFWFREKTKWPDGKTDDKIWYRKNIRRPAHTAIYLGKTFEFNA